MEKMVIEKIEQCYKEKPHLYDHLLLEVDEEITCGDLIKSYRARIQKLERRNETLDTECTKRQLEIYQLCKTLREIEGKIIEALKEREQR